MDQAQLIKRQLPPLPFQIPHLPRDEMQAPRRDRQLLHHLSRRVARTGGRLQQQFKRHRLQGIPRQHRDGIAINLVARRPPPAEIIIIHTWQIIVDQRVGMNAFNGTSRRQRRLRIPPASLASRQQQHRPQALPPRKHAMPDRRMQRRGRMVRCRQQPLQDSVHAGSLFSEVKRKIRHRELDKRLEWQAEGRTAPFVA